MSATRTAAVAGCGGGVDGVGLSEQDRAYWRKCAREWLGLELAARMEGLETSEPTDGAALRKTLASWRQDPDLAGPREAKSLDQLSQAERQECRALWDEINALIQRAQTIE